MNNRIIEFRAWDKVRKVIRTMENPTYNVTGAEFKTKHFGDLQWFFSEFVGDYELMQFTGLLDKNGKEIYEGDIISNQYTDNYLVVFRDGGFKLTPEPQGEGFVGDCSEFNCMVREVIGNVYENPELLK